MKQARIARRALAGLVGITLFLVAGAAFAEEDARTRVRKTKERIKERIEECRQAEREGETPMVAELGAELKSLAADAEGLKALAKYLDHKVDYVALLSVKAFAAAPKELQLGAGRILATRSGSRYATDKRRVVYVETVTALGKTGYLGGVQPLLKTLTRSRDPNVCRAIVLALGRLGDPGVVAVLLDRLNIGASASLRGPEGGSEARRRSQNPRQQVGVNGKRNNVATNAAGAWIETLAADQQPTDEKGVVHEIYNTLSKLLGPEFTSWHAVDQYRREHKKELKKACAEAKKKRQEQERKAAQLLR